MPLYWTDDRPAAAERESPAGGEWRDGVYVPSRQAGGRQGRTTIFHDLVRTLLELRAE